MTIEEANKIIAEFMDRRCYNCGEIDAGGCCWVVMLEDASDGYSESLDTLVPVWEEVSSGRLQLNIMSVGLFYHVAEVYNNQEELIYIHKSKSIQEAAAIVTAKVIQELE